MTADFINPFIKSASDIFKEVANINLKKSDLSVKSDPSPSNEISIIMGVTGEVEGQVVYSFKEHTAQRIVGCMMPDQNALKKKEFFHSAVSSLANMITGRATIFLSEKIKNPIYITPPTLVVGKNFDVSFVNIKTLKATFQSRFGTIEINVALQRKES